MSASAAEDEYCNDHSSNRRDFYCPKCDQDICKECIQEGGKHYGHGCITVAEEFGKELSVLLRRKDDLKEQAESLEEREKLLIEKCERACEKISESYQEVTQVVREKMREEIKGFRTKYEEDVGLKELKNHTQYVWKLHRDAASLAKKAALDDNSSGDVQFMEHRKEDFREMKKSNEFLNRLPQDLSVHEVKPVGTTAPLGLHVVEAVEQKVSAMYRFFDPHKTTIEVCERIHVNELATAKITIRDSVGDHSLVAQQFHVQLYSVRSHCTIEAKVQPHSSSEYTAEFTPTLQARGRCLVRASFDPGEIYEQEVFIECPQFIEESCLVLNHLEAPGCLHRIGSMIFMIQGNNRERCIKCIDTTCELDNTEFKMSVFIPPEKYKNWCPIEMSSSEYHIFVTDSKHNMVHKFKITGKYLLSKGGPGERKGMFKGPNGLCVTNDNVFVCDSYNHRIQVFSLELEFIRCFGSKGNKIGQFEWPSNVAFYERDSTLFVADLRNDCVQCLTECGVHLRYIGFPGSGSGSLDQPNILLISNNHLYITDRKGVSVFKVTGEFITRFALDCSAEKKKSINGLAIDKDGYRFVSDDVHDRVVVF